jgi:phenylpropionate dioxygenase-like ring-hydroxylating dioxygenase large terminal subunit
MDSFVRNAWYPAAWSRDVVHQPTQRRILGDLVCLYRASTGAVVAFDDACPHRLAPLSMGKLKGDALECGYHGMTFDCTGKCIRIPGQAVIPPRADVRAYPIVEQLGLCWIWMGDPALADPAEVYHLPAYEDSKYSILEGDALHIGCHYLSLADNLCDPAHVSFVHLSSLGGASGEDIPVHNERTAAKKLVTWRWTLDSPPVPIFAQFRKFTGNVDRWQYYHFDAPNIAVVDFGSAATGTGAPEGNRGDCLQLYSCHFLTPVDEQNCIDHWVIVKNFPTDAATTEAMRAQFRVAFNEDKVVLEAIQQNENERPDARRLRLALDAGVHRMRRMVEELLDAERVSGKASATGTAA